MGKLWKGGGYYTQLAQGNMKTQIFIKNFEVNILLEMTNQNLHAGTIGWGMILEGIQHCNKYEQNEDYHLSDHGNEEEV